MLDICTLQRGTGILNMARLEQVLKGVKSVQAKGGKKVSRLPMTPSYCSSVEQRQHIHHAMGSFVIMRVRELSTLGNRIRQELLSILPGRGCGLAGQLPGPEREAVGLQN